MSLIQIPQRRLDSAVIGQPSLLFQSMAAGPGTKALEARLRSIADPTPSFSGMEQRVHFKKTMEEQLYDALASFKMRTATIAMHLDRDWRGRLFAQLDSLLASDNWEKDDLPPTLGSFTTFVRMILFLKPERRPGMAATSDGHLIATWTKKDDRLTMECFPNDLIRWHLTAIVDDEKESAAAITPVARVAEVLLPYNPNRWFANGDNVRPA
jgi:hypothetical protein